MFFCLNLTHGQIVAIVYSRLQFFMRGTQVDPPSSGANSTLSNEQRAPRCVGLYRR